MRFLVCVALSLGLIIMGRSDSPFCLRIVAALEWTVFPIQYAVNIPFKLFHELASNFSTKRHVLAVDAEIRSHNIILEARLQQLLMLEKENAELRQLLQSTSHVNGAIMTASLLAVDVGGESHIQQMIVYKGRKQGILPGQAVLDAYGVMGQIVKVAWMTSKVLLLTDPRSAIPVQNYRNGIRSVAVGKGDAHHLVLFNIAENMDIRVHDVFITSGLGQCYPEGYPVGVVTQIEAVPGGRLKLVTLRPLAHLDRTQQVLLVQLAHPGLARVVKKQLQEDL